MLGEKVPDVREAILPDAWAEPSDQPRLEQ